jgi:hypothetical protein
LRFEKSWDEAQAAGLELDMSALKKGGLVQALFRGNKPSGQVYAIGLSASGDDIAVIHDRLLSNEEVQEYRSNYLEFIDPYQITWQIAMKPVFRTAGDFANRWLVI